MRYGWKNYSEDDAMLVDSWLDDDAVRKTGIEDGRQNFYDYQMAESRKGEGKDCCFVISEEQNPFAVIYIGIIGNEIVISEYIVAPDMRGKGYGTGALKELTENSDNLLSVRASAVQSVIFTSNTASV